MEDCGDEQQTYDSNYNVNNTVGSFEASKICEKQSPCCISKIIIQTSVKDNKLKCVKLLAGNNINHRMGKHPRISYSYYKLRFIIESYPQPKNSYKKEYVYDYYKPL